MFFFMDFFAKKGQDAAVDQANVQFDQDECIFSFSTFNFYVFDISMVCLVESFLLEKFEN